MWLLPTSRFRRTAFEQRGSLWEMATRTSNPDRALHNLLERDRMFTERLRADVQRLGLPAIEVDTTMSEAELATRVADVLTLTAAPPG